MRKRPSSHWIPTILFVCTILSVFVSCEKDETNIPSFRADLLCANVNADSLVSSLQLDNGRVYQIASQKIKTETANKKIRCYASYSISDDSIHATVYDISVVPCVAPLPADSFQAFPQSPVKVVSVWRTPGFVNLCLAPLVNKDMKCKYGICIDTLISRTLHTSFLFEKTQDVPEAYTVRLYHSIPLQSPTYTQDFDTLSLTINTVEGMKTYTFPR